MPDLILTTRRTGDYESRTEEYEMTFAVEDNARSSLRVRYQAARAYEINAALDAAVESSRETISEALPDLPQPTDEALTQFAWRSMQSAKYGAGEPVISRLNL